MTDSVRITDVSPRDGLQNEPGFVATADKARLVGLLLAAGVDEVEVTSFVSPKWVPQLADAPEVLALLRPPRRQMLSVLVPNEAGLQRALDANHRAGANLITKVSVFTAASETFSKRNTNASIAETIARFRPVVDDAQDLGLTVRGYLSCAIACPFEGPIAPAAVADVAARLLELGVDEIDLGDTIGAGTPETTAAMLRAVAARVPPEVDTTLHLHDTFGRAAACVKAALDEGVRSFDGSAAGLGGCPYAGGRAPGNISTELLVRTIHAAGFTTGVDLGALAKAAEFAREIVARAAPTGAA